MSGVTTIEAGDARVYVERRAGGWVLRVEQLTGSRRARLVAKFDAFGNRPHLHLYAEGGAETVEPVDRRDPIRESLRRIRRLGISGLDELGSAIAARLADI